MKSLILHNIRFIGIRMIWSLFVIFFLYLVYFFHTSSVQICGYQINNTFHTYVEHLEWWFYILVYFTIISFFNTIVFFFLSFYFILKKEIIQEIKRKYELIFSEIIIDYIYSDLLKGNLTIEEYFTFFKKLEKRKFWLKLLIWRFKLLSDYQRQID